MSERLAPEGFKPLVVLPEALLDVPVRTPRKKTNLMGRIEFKYDTPIIPLLKYWREELGWKSAHIARALEISPTTAGEWIKDFGIGPRAKTKRRAA